MLFSTTDAPICELHPSTTFRSRWLTNATEPLSVPFSSTLLTYIFERNAGALLDWFMLPHNLELAIDAFRVDFGFSDTPISEEECLKLSKVFPSLTLSFRIPPRNNISDAAYGFCLLVMLDSLHLVSCYHPLSSGHCLKQALKQTPAHILQELCSFIGFEPVTDADVGLLMNNVLRGSPTHKTYELINRFGPPECWDMSAVTSLQYIGKHVANYVPLPSTFNRDINGWDVRKVKSLRGFFAVMYVFDQPLDHWQLDSLTDLGFAFCGAASFNQPLFTWNVGQVTHMDHCFEDASAFDQPLHTWKVDQVETMQSMFANARSFTQSVNNWDVQNVRSFDSMFAGAIRFNQPIDRWRPTKLQNAHYMFAGTYVFNQSLRSLGLYSSMHFSSAVNEAHGFHQPMELVTTRAPNMPVVVVTRQLPGELYGYMIHMAEVSEKMTQYVFDVFCRHPDVDVLYVLEDGIFVKTVTSTPLSFTHVPSVMFSLRV